VRNSSKCYLAELCLCAIRQIVGLRINIIHLSIVLDVSFLFVSSACAQTWTQTSAPITNWTSVASSADGMKLVAAAGGSSGKNISGFIYTSTNAGGIWTEQTNAPGMNWQSVASSADGVRLLAIAGSKSSSYASGSGIFTSDDGGVTWKSNNVRQAFYSGGASSTDGTNLIAAYPFTFSTNAGAAWYTNNSPLVNALAASADCSTIVAGGISGPLHVTTNLGVSWTSALSAGGWPSFASSADGNTLLAYGVGYPLSGGLFTSTDRGATWRTNSVSPFTYQYVTSSADGEKFALALQFGGIFASTNSGFTWTQTGAPNQYWKAISSSADGNSLVAVVDGGGIWVSRTTPSPKLTASILLTNVQISWVIPSTDSVLQESLNLVDWSDVTNEPTLNLTNLQNQVTLPLSESNNFFRLKTP
jgi:hypothetical protein